MLKYVVFVLCVLGASATDGLHQRTVDAAASAPPAVNIRHVNTMNFNVVVGDFNGDGIVDLVGSEPWVNEPPFLTIALGKGDGTFAPATRIGWVARAVAAADFDGDGKVDLLVKGLPENDSPVSVIAGRGDGTFATPPAPRPSRSRRTCTSPAPRTSPVTGSKMSCSAWTSGEPTRFSSFPATAI